METIKNYRDVIAEVFGQRLSTNPRYSLRAFARDLSITPGQLSLVLAKKRGISPERAKKVFQKLGIDSEEIHVLTLQVTKEHARGKRQRAKAAQLLTEQNEASTLQLTQDAFRVISEWYHFAILQVLTLKGASYQRDSESFEEIAKKIGIQKIEVKLAFDRLERLNLIEVNTKGLFKVCHDTVITTDGVPSKALRQFHRGVIEKALKSIDTQTIEERYLNSIILPVLTISLPEIKNDILRFQKSIMKKYGRNKLQDGEQVYALSQQLFKITEV